GVSTPGATVGVVMLMLGNSALSMLPYIMYDHDYPLIMNVYTDSVFGIAGVLIIVLYLLRIVDRRDGIACSWRPATLVVPAVIMAAFNYTAELNALIIRSEEHTSELQ